MTGPVAGTSERDAHLVQILDEYLAALHSGKAPSREMLLHQHPDLAEDIKECLASLDFIEQASIKAPAPDVDLEPEELKGVLGDFCIYREIGRGGMGVVYEAEQISLGRRVALKVLPFAATLDAKLLHRFKREAHAAASLHHTSIVPVFAVGYERGLHFYAMQYIEGQSLSALISSLRELKNKDGHKPKDDATLRPESTDTGSAHSSLEMLSTTGIRHRSFFHAVARLGIQAAEALEYAHEQGVIHRDIKPANILLDVRGNLWIADFGLAHFQNNVDLTLTGDIVGTLRYMSPEQAMAKRIPVDHRTDIYSLGVTLYELMTQERAFSGRDREELLRQIAFEEPRSPRRCCRSIPVELETIILTAMRKNPAERYNTAQELADDLRRFLEDKPILARPPTIVQRLAKWGRRHRMVVGTSVGILILAVIGLTVSNVLILRERNQVLQFQRKSEANFRLAREVVDEMYTEVAEKWLEGQPQLEPLQVKFLESALRYYQEFLKEENRAPEIRLQAARSYMRVAQIYWGLKRIADSERSRYSGS